MLQKVKKLSRMKEEGNEAFKVGAFEKAYDLYSEALTIDPHNKVTNAKIFCNRANAGGKVRMLMEIYLCHIVANL